MVYLSSAVCYYVVMRLEGQDAARKREPVSSVGLFIPGMQVVCYRHKERIVEGKIDKIEEGKAFVSYPYNGKTITEEVPLQVLKNLNPGLKRDATRGLEQGTKGA